MSIRLSTSFPNCVNCNFDCKEEIKICREAYDNVETLRSRNDHLIKCEEDLQERIFHAADLLNNWVQEAKKVSGEIESILKQEQKNCCFCLHRYKFGTRVITKLKMVDDLQSRLGQLDIPRMRVEKSEIEQLRKGIDEILAKKVDLERRFPTEQLTEEVTTWSKEVDRQCQQAQVFMQRPNGADYLQFRALVDETVTKIGELKAQRERWGANDIVVEKYPKESDIHLLRIAIDKISASRRDLANRFQHREFTEEVKIWMREVDIQCEEGNAVLDKAKANHGFDHELGRQVDVTGRIIGGLQEQHSKWDDENIVVDKPQSVVEKPSWYSPHLKDMESKVNEVLDYLRGDKFFIIRIFGDGGIGKTTLLTEINNALYRESSNNCFSKVIFVTVSQKWSISEIQDQIASRLGLSNDKRFHECSVEEKAEAVFGALGRESFLLLLDDVWEELDLAKIGIPQPTKCSKRSKIVFTSRFGSMCSDIGVGKTIQMKHLNEDPSWELFSEAAVGNGNKALPEVAREVASLCGGLPLALKVIGLAVADLERTEEWEDAVRQLRKSTRGHVGRKTEEKVYKVLRYSFDKLEDEVTRSCFIFCCLFGQGGHFDEEKVIGYWIGEGILLHDDQSLSHRLGSLRSRGRHILRNLVQVCLLQKLPEKERLSHLSDLLYVMHESEEQFLRMHDMIYGMADMIETEKREPKTLRIGYEVAISAAAKRARINESDLTTTELPRLYCPCLTTLSFLFSPYSRLRLPDEFFDQMCSLCVLDLSKFGMTRLPSSICSLNLLRSLDLSRSSIQELPTALGQLVNLLLLDLSRTMYLSNIPKGAVSPLINLLSLNLHGSLYNHLYEDNEEQVGLCDLDKLTRLEEFMPPLVRSVCQLDLFSRLPRLFNLIRKLDLRGESIVVGYSMLCSLERLPNLEYLRTMDCSMEDTLMGSRDFNSLRKLRQLRLSGCKSVVDISWLLYRVPNLELLLVSGCNQLERLFSLPSDIETPSTVDCLSKLKTMSLWRLPELSSIADGHLVFDSLLEFNVLRCEKLKKLSFPFVEREQKIRCGCYKRWWRDLEWDDEHSKSMFTFFLY